MCVIVKFHEFNLHNYVQANANKSTLLKIPEAMICKDPPTYKQPVASRWTTSIICKGCLKLGVFNSLGHRWSDSVVRASPLDRKFAVLVPHIAILFGRSKDVDILKSLKSA